MSVVGESAAIVTAAGALVAVGGGYVEFVLKRSILPSVEFDVEFSLHHRGQKQVVGEVACVVKNVGSSMAIVTNVRYKARYRLTTDQETYFEDQVEPNLEHGLSWISLVGPRTFVQPGVTQRYRKPFAMPASAQLLKVVGSFDYKINMGRTTSALIWLVARPPKGLDWRKGISNHTVERSFSLQPSADDPLASEPESEGHPQAG